MVLKPGRKPPGKLSAERELAGVESVIPPAAGEARVLALLLCFLKGVSQVVSKVT